MSRRVAPWPLYLAATLSMLNPVGAAESAASATDGAALRAELARLRGAGAQQEAARLMEEWLQRHPRDERIYLQLGQHYADHHNAAQALATWQRLLQKVPGREDLYRSVSNRVRRLGMNEQALEILVDARAQLDRAAFSWEIAQMHLEAGRYEAGVRSMIEHLKVKPGHRPIVEGYLRSMVSGPSSTRIPTRLLQSLEETARNSLTAGDAADAVSVSQIAAVVAVETGHPEKALGLIEMIHDLPGAAAPIYELASLAEARGYQEEALAAYDLLLQHYPDSHPQRARAQLRRGELLVSRGQPKLAETTYLSLAQGAQGRPEAAQALLRAAELQLEINDDPRTAAATLKRLFDHYQRGGWSQPALALSAECALRLDDLDTYARHLRQRRQQAPDDIGVRFDLARLAYYRADFAAAIGLLDSLVRADPGSDTANDALQLLLLIEAQQSEHEALSMLARAELLERQRRRERAAAAWAWLSANASSEMAERSLWQRAQLREREALDEALGIYEQMLASFPDGRLVLPARLGRARMLEQSGRVPEALKAYEMALLRFPTDPTAPRIRLNIQRLRQATRTTTGDEG